MKGEGESAKVIESKKITFFKGCGKWCCKNFYEIE